MTNDTGTCSRPNCPNRPTPWGHGLCRTHWLNSPGHRRWKKRVPADVARKHLEKVVAAGGAITTIAQEIGVRNPTLYRILHGEQPTCSVYVHDRIMTATPDMTRSPFAWPLTRRLQALRAAGWNVDELTEALGVSRQFIISMCAGKRNRVHVKTDRMIREFYDEHKNDPVREPSTRVAKRGWARPWDWDDIDNPDETPTKEFDTLAELLTALVDRMGSQKAVCEATGISTSYLSQFLAERYVRSEKWEPIFNDLWRSLNEEETA